MKKIAMMLVALSTAFVCHAQFEQGKKFIGASVTGLNLSYSGSEKSNLGFDTRVGYAVEDNWMLMAQGSVNLYGNDDISDCLMIGAGCRYYIVQNGLYLGANVKLLHTNHNYNDLMPGFEIGYAYSSENRSPLSLPCIMTSRSRNIPTIQKSVSALD